MLKACLDSLAVQRTPDGASLSIVVVDNESAPNNHTAVEAFASGCPFPVHYVHEKEQGISQARNAALDAALQAQAHWIAFIDDDEVADQNWVSELYAAAYRHGRSSLSSIQGVDGDQPGSRTPADVILGPIRYTFPEDAGQWRKRKCYPNWGKTEGQELPAASTNNVIFRTALVERHGLRFRNELGLSGSEDVLFFRSMHEVGASIRWSFHPVVTETVPWDRITFKGHIRKSFRVGMATVESGRLFDDRYSGKKHVRRAVRRGALGVLKVAISPALIVLGPGVMMHALMSGMRNISQSAGIVAALRGLKYEYYRETTGF